MPHKSSTSTQRVKRAVFTDTECIHCDRKFSSWTAYKLHLRVSHGDKNAIRTEAFMRRICASCKKELPYLARRCDKGCT